MTFPGLFAELAKAYIEHFKLSESEWRTQAAHVAALCYRNAAKNPLAHIQNGPATAAAILGLPDSGKGSNMMVAAPLRLHDCSLVSDGAAGWSSAAAKPARRWRDRRHRPLGERRPSGPTCTNWAGKDAAAKAYKKPASRLPTRRGGSPDCFTINQILSTEALGLAADGRAGYEYLEGRFTRDDPKVAINLSGGLKSKGHPVGATGASMHALIYKQLIGEAIGVKAKKADIGVAFNVGGSAVTNCVTVMKKL
jgi:acetyl-CoA C-acetyltransferase